MPIMASGGIPGIILPANWFATSLKMQNELSIIRLLIGSGLVLWSNLRAVDPPIDLPQRATCDVLPLSERCFSTAYRSSVSFQPRVTHSPSEFPHPEKSNAHKSHPSGNTRSCNDTPSCLFPAFPCIYTTQGLFVSGWDSVLDINTH